MPVFPPYATALPPQMPAMPPEMTHCPQINGGAARPAAERGTQRGGLSRPSRTKGRKTATVQLAPLRGSAAPTPAPPPDPVGPLVAAYAP
eukprot:243869-Rhodomonas_salina.1